MIAIAENVADPEQPVTLDKLVAQFAPDIAGPQARPRWKFFLAMVLVLAALTAMWRYTPLAAWADAERITAWADRFSKYPWAPLIVMAAYTPASLVLFPRP